MKRMLLLWCVILLHGLVHAQDPVMAAGGKKDAQPYLFRSLPARFEANLMDLLSFIGRPAGESVSSQISSRLFLKGRIISKTQRVPGTYSMNIKLENYDDALFNISVTTLPDKSLKIQGRILHRKYADVLILTMENNRLYFKKEQLKLFMTE